MSNATLSGLPRCANPSCNKLFQPTRSDNVFCSKRCGDYASKMRKQAQQNAPRCLRKGCALTCEPGRQFCTVYCLKQHYAANIASRAAAFLHSSESQRRQREALANFFAGHAPEPYPQTCLSCNSRAGGCRCSPSSAIR